MNFLGYDPLLPNYPLHPLKFENVQTPQLMTAISKSILHPRFV